MLDSGRSISVHHSITMLDCIAQDRPDLSVATHVLPQQVSQPTEGTQAGLKRVVP